MGDAAQDAHSGCAFSYQSLADVAEPPDGSSLHPMSATCGGPSEQAGRFGVPQQNWGNDHQGQLHSCNHLVDMPSGMVPALGVQEVPYGEPAGFGASTDNQGSGFCQSPSCADVCGIEVGQWTPHPQSDLGTWSSIPHGEGLYLAQHSDVATAHSVSELHYIDPHQHSLRESLSLPNVQIAYIDPHSTSMCSSAFQGAHVQQMVPDSAGANSDVGSGLTGNAHQYREANPIETLSQRSGSEELLEDSQGRNASQHRQSLTGINQGVLQQHWQPHDQSTHAVGLMQELQPQMTSTVMPSSSHESPSMHPIPNGTMQVDDCVGYSGNVVEAPSGLGYVDSQQSYVMDPPQKTYVDVQAGYTESQHSYSHAQQGYADRHQQFVDASQSYIEPPHNDTRHGYPDPSQWIDIEQPPQSYADNQRGFVEPVQQAYADPQQGYNMDPPQSSHQGYIERSRQYGDTSLGYVEPTQQFVETQVYVDPHPQQGQAEPLQLYADADQVYLERPQRYVDAQQGYVEPGQHSYGDTQNAYVEQPQPYIDATRPGYVKQSSGFAEQTLQPYGDAQQGYVEVPQPYADAHQGYAETATGPGYPTEVQPVYLETQTTPPQFIEAAIPQQGAQINLHSSQSQLPAQTAQAFLDAHDVHSCQHVPPQAMEFGQGYIEATPQQQSSLQVPQQPQSCSEPTPQQPQSCAQNHLCHMPAHAPLYEVHATLSHQPPTHLVPSPMPQSQKVSPRQQYTDNPQHGHKIYREAMHPQVQQLSRSCVDFQTFQAQQYETHGSIASSSTLSSQHASSQHLLPSQLQPQPQSQLHIGCIEAQQNAPMPLQHRHSQPQIVYQDPTLLMQQQHGLVHQQLPPDVQVQAVYTAADAMAKAQQRSHGHKLRKAEADQKAQMAAQASTHSKYMRANACAEAEVHARLHAKAQADAARYNQQATQANDEAEQAAWAMAAEYQSQSLPGAYTPQQPTQAQAPPSGLPQQYVQTPFHDGAPGQRFSYNKEQMAAQLAVQQLQQMPPQVQLQVPQQALLTPLQPHPQHQLQQGAWPGSAQAAQQAAQQQGCMLQLQVPSPQVQHQSLMQQPQSLAQQHVQQPLPPNQTTPQIPQPLHQATQQHQMAPQLLQQQVQVQQHVKVPIQHVLMQHQIQNLQQYLPSHAHQAPSHQQLQQHPAIPIRPASPTYVLVSPQLVSPQPPTAIQQPAPGLQATPHQVQSQQVPPGTSFDRQQMRHMLHSQQTNSQSLPSTFEHSSAPFQGAPPQQSQAVMQPAVVQVQQVLPTRSQRLAQEPPQLQPTIPQQYPHPQLHQVQVGPPPLQAPQNPPAKQPQVQQVQQLSQVSQAIPLQQVKDSPSTSSLATSEDVNTRGQMSKMQAVAEARAKAKLLAEQRKSEFEKAQADAEHWDKEFAVIASETNSDKRQGVDDYESYVKRRQEVRIKKQQQQQQQPPEVSLQKKCQQQCSDHQTQALTVPPTPSATPPPVHNVGSRPQPLTPFPPLQRKSREAKVECKYEKLSEQLKQVSIESTTKKRRDKEGPPDAGVQLGPDVEPRHHPMQQALALQLHSQEQLPRIAPIYSNDNSGLLPSPRPSSQNVQRQAGMAGMAPPMSGSSGGEGVVRGNCVCQQGDSQHQPTGGHGCNAMGQSSVHISVGSSSSTASELQPRPGEMPQRQKHLRMALQQGRQAGHRSVPQLQNAHRRLNPPPGSMAPNAGPRYRIRSYPSSPKGVGGWKEQDSRFSPDTVELLATHWKAQQVMVQMLIDSMVQGESTSCGTGQVTVECSNSARHMWGSSASLQSVASSSLATPVFGSAVSSASGSPRASPAPDALASGSDLQPLAASCLQPNDSPIEEKLARQRLEVSRLLERNLQLRADNMALLNMLDVNQGETDNIIKLNSACRDPMLDVLLPPPPPPGKLAAQAQRQAGAHAAQHSPSVQEQPNESPGIHDRTHVGNELVAVNTTCNCISAQSTSVPMSPASQGPQFTVAISHPTLESSNPMAATQQSAAPPSNVAAGACTPSAPITLQSIPQGQSNQSMVADSAAEGDSSVSHPPSLLVSCTSVPVLSSATNSLDGAQVSSCSSPRGVVAPEFGTIPSAVETAPHGFVNKAWQGGTQGNFSDGAHVLCPEPEVNPIEHTVSPTTEQALHMSSEGSLPVDSRQQ